MLDEGRIRRCVSNRRISPGRVQSIMTWTSSSMSLRTVWSRSHTRVVWFKYTSTLRLGSEQAAPGHTETQKSESTSRMKTNKNVRLVSGGSSSTMASWCNTRAALRCGTERGTCRFAVIVETPEVAACECSVTDINVRPSAMIDALRPKSVADT